MLKKGRKKASLFSCLWILIIAVSSQGCGLMKRDLLQDKKTFVPLNKIVVLGFRPAMPQGREPGMVRSPFSGAVFMARPVREDVPDKLTAKLFDRIRQNEKYEMIGPNQARGVFASLVSSDQGMKDGEVFARIGRSFSADAVIVGYIYRWQAREGTNYSVRRPASVAFDLYLIEPQQGTVLWWGKFDKVQKSLSENILDVGTFLKSKGRWMTAAELADLGLTELLDKSPLEMK
jgi:hypothetical protein